MNIDLDKLEQVARAATPGPWASVHHAVVEANGGHLICPVSDTRGKYEYERGNRDYIAALSPDVVIELVRRLRAAEADAARYRHLRDNMSFSTSAGEVPEMGLRAWMPAPEHNPHADWVGERFDASVDRTVDAAIAAQGASHD